MTAAFILCSALAQAPAPEGAPAPAAAVEVPATPEPSAADITRVVTEHRDDEAFRIGKLVRCPVCQGMSIAESPSQMAQDMMRKTRELVAAGQNEAEILAYFEDRYGEFARLSPRTDGVGLWVWILPPVLVLGAVFWVGSWLRRRRAPSPPSPPQTSGAVSDPYLEAIRKQVSE